MEKFFSEVAKAQSNLSDVWGLFEVEYLPEMTSEDKKRMKKHLERMRFKINAMLEDLD